ncbi:hypothetical protein DPMN_068995 [Dreissena polymorpha]|uniref:MADF domain-containing protein n=1 Tax=Dreissena polymorpha TaxID=45954 RepID=A0A9D4BUN4_DREPO|nr:hypothetical protein DPMN_068995 [Dreissena polymorpha]
MLSDVAASSGLSSNRKDFLSTLFHHIKNVTKFHQFPCVECREFSDSPVSKVNVYVQVHRVNLINSSRLKSFQTKIDPIDPIDPSRPKSSKVNPMVKDIQNFAEAFLERYEEGPNFGDARHCAQNWGTKSKTRALPKRCTAEASVASGSELHHATLEIEMQQPPRRSLLSRQLNQWSQDQPDNEEIQPGDDQPEEGRATAGAEGNDNPQKKSRRKAILLDNDTQEQLIEWVREHELLWRKGATDYTDTKKKTELWTRKARELNIEEGAEVLRTWWKSARDLHVMLICKKSGKAAANLTDRELFIQRNCAFLHKEVKYRKGQPLRNIPLTQENLPNQPPKAQPSASTSILRQPSHDVEEQEEDHGSLSLTETQAPLTRSQGTHLHYLSPPPQPDHAVPQPDPSLKTPL